MSSKLHELLDYGNIPNHPIYGKPEYYRLWIALILLLFKELKGTSTYYEALPMTIKEIIGTDSKTASLKELLDMIKDNTALIEELRKDLTTLENSFNEYVEQTDARLAIIENNIKKLFSEITRLDTRIDNLKTYVDQLIDALDIRVTALENRMDNAETNITNLNTRIDSVIEMVNNLKEYVDGNFIPADINNGVTRIVVSANNAPTGDAAKPYMESTLWIKINP